MNVNLSVKEERFVREYLVDLNGMKAAIRSGYSPKTASSQASRLLTRVKVQEYLQKLKAECVKRCEVSADMLLREFMAIGFSKISDFLIVEEVEETGVKINEDTLEFEPYTYKRKQVRIFNTDEVDPEKVKAIAEIEQTKTGIRVKLHDKKGALQDIAKHLGWYEKDNGQQNKIVIQPTAAELKASRDKLKNEY